MFLFQQSDYDVNYSDVYTKVFLKIKGVFVVIFKKEKSQ